MDFHWTSGFRGRDINTGIIDLVGMVYHKCALILVLGVNFSL